MVKYLDPVPFIAGLSVMIVAGLLLTRITRYPSSRSARTACVPL
jgi:hypothetical protein